MSSLSQVSFVAPTTPPLSFYTPLFADGLTGLDSARPGLLITVEWVLQRILALTTTARTFGFKWLSLSTFSRRRLNLPATPTLGYYLEPTATFITSGNSNPTIFIIPLLALILSVIFGAGLVHFGRRTPHFTAYKMKHEPSLKSLYSESPTLFDQDGTVLPPASDMPRFSFFWIGALKFILCGLAFLFRLIRMDKLLNMVEDTTTAQKPVTSTASHIAELRSLDKKLVQVINNATPTHTAANPIRSPDANETLVAPSPAHAKYKLGQLLLSSAANKVHIIPPPKGIQACPPVCIEISPSTTLRSTTRKVTFAPAVDDHARNRRSTSCLDAGPSVAPFSVEPSGVPGGPLATSSPPSKPSKFSRPIVPPSADDNVDVCPTCTETSTRNASVGPAVDPVAIGNPQGGGGTNPPSILRPSSRTRPSTSSPDTGLNVAPFYPSAVPEPLATPSPLSESSSNLIRPISSASSAADKAVVIPPSKDIKAPPTRTESPAPTFKASFSPAVSDPVVTGNASATSVTIGQGGEGMNLSLPTPNRRSSLRSRRPAVAPFSVEPPGILDKPLATSSPLSKSSYKPLRPSRLTIVDCPSTPPRHNETASPSVEPSGVPDRVVAPLDPQAELKRIFARCLEDSPRRPRYSKAATLDPEVASKLPSESVQAELRRIFQPCFEDPRLQPKSSTPATLTSVRPLDPPFEFGTNHRKSVSVRKEECPNTTPANDFTATHRSLKDFRLQLTRDRLASTHPSTDAEANRPRITPQKDITATYHGTKDVRLQSTPSRLASTLSSTGAEETRPLSSTPRQGVPPRLTRASTHSSTDEEENRPQRLISTSQKNIAASHSTPSGSTPVTHQTSPPKIAPKATDPPGTAQNLSESVEAIRERVRRTIERASKASASTDIRIRTKYPVREAQPDEQPRRQRPISTDADRQAVHEETPRDKARKILEQIRQDHKDLFARVHETLRYHDEKRELRAKSMASRLTAQTRERPVSTLPSKYRSIVEAGVDKTIQTRNRPVSTLPSKYPNHIKPRESQEVAPTHTRERPVSTLHSSPAKPGESQDVATQASGGSKFGRKTEPGVADQVARLHSLLELDVPAPVSDDRSETGSEENQASTVEVTSWSFEGYIRPATDDEPSGSSTAEHESEKGAGLVESSWEITDDEIWYYEETQEDVDVEIEDWTTTTPICSPRLRPRTFSESTRGRPRAPIVKEPQPQILHDLFYSPTFPHSNPQRREAPNTCFLKGEKVAGFGCGSPYSRRIQRLDPRDTFETSTPRVNYANFGGFCTSTPRRGVEHRRDSWANFF